MDYGRAFSYANSSAVSNIMLRKGVRFGSVARDFYDNALIWDYARNAGYRSYLYDAQGSGVGHNYFDSIERKMIDVNISNTKIRSDLEIIQRLQYFFDEQKTFTLIIKKGDHFPYDAYPKDYELGGEFDLYKMKTSKRIKYLKSILYQSDLFWKEFLQLKIKEPTLVIYTSDHGQNLEDVAGLTHGSTENPYIGEGLVPLVILSNIQDVELERNFKNNINCASHFNIFPTLLEAMGYRVDELGYIDFNASLFHEIKSVSGFYYGIPFGYFGKRPNFKHGEGGGIKLP